MRIRGRRLAAAVPPPIFTPQEWSGYPPPPSPLKDPPPEPFDERRDESPTASRGRIEPSSPRSSSPGTPPTPCPRFCQECEGAGRCAKGKYAQLSEILKERPGRRYRRDKKPRGFHSNAGAQAKLESISDKSALRDDRLTVLCRAVGLLDSPSDECFASDKLIRMLRIVFLHDRRKLKVVLLLAMVLRQPVNPKLFLGKTSKAPPYQRVLEDVAREAHLGGEPLAKLCDPSSLGYATIIYLGYLRKILECPERNTPENRTILLKLIVFLMVDMHQFGLQKSTRVNNYHWTPDEVNQLVEGISDLGVGRWTELKSSYFPTSIRTAQHLKDKWRNLLIGCGLQIGKKRKVEVPKVTGNLKDRIIDLHEKHWAIKRRRASSEEEEGI
ncbi:hypothetical protein EJB05_04290 [Eragrostis curvula]|uniref:Uncharacterized protein n=1 Tax=Eragrostis curvula TaxID=38414 RepID=A0A5J9WBQ9_9POAL|nr:hypothetical protein EJB05_04290 [Eragrostis curvula]